MNRRTLPVLFLVVSVAAVTLADESLPAGEIVVTETADEVRIETDAIAAIVRKSGYVSGIAGGSFLDKRTGARDLGFGSHVMDFLLAPGWRDDGYERDRKLHGDLPKHYVEGPQICTQAKSLPVEVLRGNDFAALRMSYTFREPGQGYDAGSVWQQTIVFQPGVRYVVSAERITSANDVDNIFYRIDMPGHLRHAGNPAESFEQIYLSYHEKPIPASTFAEDFAPDARFLYRRTPGGVPERFIRAYQVRNAGQPGPWFTGMTLDPSAASEAWCHERGYICFIQELHGRPVAKGESIGAAYLVGWFDDIPSMHAAYDRHRGVTGIKIEGGRFVLERPE